MRSVEISKNWLAGIIDKFTDELDKKSVTEFNEANRYLPRSVTTLSGFINYDITPYWREILDCFSLDSGINEVAVQKGVQIAATTALESILFYAALYVKTQSCMFATADHEMAQARLENNIITMFQQSGFGHIFRSSDVDSSHKKGVSKKQLQWEGGGFLIPTGAQNPDRFRSFSIDWMMMDEIETFKLNAKQNGDSVALLKSRCAARWEKRKIYMCSTPLLKGMSNIEKEFLKGDQRYYFVRCLRCGFAQRLKWRGNNPDTKKEFGFFWDFLPNGELDFEAVRYECANCNEAHFEHHKTKLFSLDNAEWRPTATATEPSIRSYHLSSLYSPVGFQPWSRAVVEWLEAWDVKYSRTKDIGKLQVFYNNILGDTFEPPSTRVSISLAYSHRRDFYGRGELRNAQIQQYCGSKISVVFCAVDVHKNNLAVATFGFARGGRSWLLDYWRLEAEEGQDCDSADSSVWMRLRELIENHKYVSDDGRIYPIAVTLVDSGYSNSVVVDFCSSFEAGVYPVAGREHSARTSAIKEFSEFKTQLGTVGFLIAVDYYKDRLASVLRREWNAAEGLQPYYHFNAPRDMGDEELRELTREYKIQKKAPNGGVSHVWYRPSGAKNELWDLLIYASAGLEILAHNIVVKTLGVALDWDDFFDFIDEEKMFFE